MLAISLTTWRNTLGQKAETAQQSFSFIRWEQNWTKNGDTEQKANERLYLTTTAKPCKCSFSVLKMIILLSEPNMISLMIKSKT